MTSNQELSLRPRMHNLAGKRFGRVTVTTYLGKVGGRTRWEYRCDCGRTGSAATANLNSGFATQCRDCAHKARGLLVRTHGRSKTPEWTIWTHIRQRCYNPNDHAYCDYGGRGITVCPEWRDSFAAFFRDMGLRPSPDHTIERTDNSGPYSPENCVWADSKTQARNTRQNHMLTHNGITQCLAAWSESCGVGSATIRYRLKRGWSVARAIETPPILSGWQFSHSKHPGAKG